LIFLVVNFTLAGFYGQSQTTSRADSDSAAGIKKSVIYDDNLSVYDFDSLARASRRGVVVITGTSCIGCVEYFAKQNVANTFIYFISDLSIMEMDRVRFQANGGLSTFYYALRTPENEYLFAQKSPQLIVMDAQSTRIFDYDDLSRLTNGFTLKGKKARKHLAISD
jgi:hypothetical protein